MASTLIKYYRISRPIRRTFFPPKNVVEIRSASYVPRVSIISKLINTRTSIIQQLYREIVKTTMKMILVAVTTIFWVSMMNKLYYGHVTILFSSNKLLKLKYIHHYLFLKSPTKTSRCVLWAGKYGTSVTKSKSSSWAGM